MVKLTEQHWTARSVEDFLYRIGADFVRQLQRVFDAGRVNQATIAKRLAVSAGRVSQVLNNPGNLTLRKMIEYAGAAGQKVTIVTYDDGDPENKNGPVSAEIFLACWERAGRPTDFFALDDGLSKHQVEFVIRPEYAPKTAGTSEILPPVRGEVRELGNAGTNADRSGAFRAGVS